MSTFSQITAEKKKAPARRDGERLFLSGCLHYSCKKLHAGQWISRKLRLRSTMGAIETGAAIHQREDESCSSGDEWLSSGEVQRGRNRWRYGKHGRRLEARNELILPRAGNDRTLISPYQYE